MIEHAEDLGGAFSLVSLFKVFGGRGEPQEGDANKGTRTAGEAVSNPVLSCGTPAGRVAAVQGLGHLRAGEVRDACRRGQMQPSASRQGEEKRAVWQAFLMNSAVTYLVQNLLLSVAARIYAQNSMHFQLVHLMPATAST